MDEQQVLERILEIADTASNYSVYTEELLVLPVEQRADALGTGVQEVRDALVALVKDIDPAMVPWWAEVS